MSPTLDMDLRAASTFVDQACWLTEPHLERVPALGYYRDQLAAAVRGIRVVSNNTRAAERQKSLRLFND